MTTPSARQVSRRSFLAMIPATAALAACSSSSSGSTHDVHDFGAVGDGRQDDSAAIGRAVAQMRTGDTLYFPAGTYRYGQRDPDGGAAISLTGLDRVGVEFDARAELVMDNLADDGSGTSHGLVVRGPASQVSLRGVQIRWATQPSQRSFGDGIRVVGYPSDGSSVPAEWTGSKGPVSGVTLADCAIRSSPQAGVIMMGVSDVTVTNVRATDTMADGIHFNACRRGQVRNCTASNTGDDGLALVTYHSESDGFDNDAETFSLSALTDWSDADFTIADITVSDGAANGVRLAGANRVTATGVSVTGVRTGAGVIVDSAAPDSDTEWKYLASQGIRLTGLTVEDGESGVHVLARPEGAADDTFSRFDFELSEITVRRCERWSALVESTATRPATGVTLRGLTVAADDIADGTGIVGLQTTRGVTFGEVDIESTTPAIAFSANRSDDFEVDRIAVTVTGSPRDRDSAGPALSFQESTGRITAAEITWRGAPSSWTAVSATTRSACAPGATPENPVAIEKLETTPARLSDPVEVVCR
ncbi:glycosyl hydrolase family 28-related protein [Gordonia sp. ABSL11-1]|uniref:glycosyl hydrolase family 28-related protein n=1 Tax=Gordonia sp. ABSL11-1 TaxID=3053924 RepID=UPI002573DDFB|nr:glycosyl hydrolase family 28-related protein [Gordonia sp. ABSL11-1]MDL9947970.1 glycosyl hydrolase family 28-related protein [Gordonia sp. ABSL11-1]